MIWEDIFHVVSLLSWVDYCEVGLLWVLIYKISLWLSYDNKTNLLLYFYAYFGSFFAVDLIGLPVIQSLLFLTAPIIGVLFVVFHHEQLQRNLVAFRTIRQPSSGKLQQEVITTIMRALLQALNAQKPLKIIIEQSDALALQSGNLIDATISADIFSLILGSQIWDFDTFVWLQGSRIKGFNAHPTWQNDSRITHEDKDPLADWLQDALLLTAKTDALVISVQPATRYFTLIAQGKLLDHVNAETALRLMQAYCGDKTKEDGYEIIRKQMARQQAKS